MSFNRVVVTGGAGFIGSHVVDGLIAQGASVLVVDDFSSGLEENLQQAQASGKLEVLKADICDSTTSQKIISYKPEAFFHLAAQMNVRRSVDDPVFDGTVNVIGTINLLEAARQVNAQAFLFASTGGAIYGEQEEFPATESHPTKAESPYGISKHAAELYLEYYSRAHKMSMVALRLANIFGPRQNPKGEAGVVAIFCENLVKGKTLYINGDGRQTRDYVYVADVVEAFIKASSKLAAPGFHVFNVGTGVETSVLELAKYLREIWEELAQVHSRQAECTIEHRQAMSGEQFRSVIDASKIFRELGWNAKTDLVPDLRSTLQYTLSRF